MPNGLWTAKEGTRFAFTEKGVIDSYSEGKTELQRNGAWEVP